MDIWVEFKYATRAQAEALYRNFFPCVEGPVWRDGSWVKNTTSEAEAEKSDVDNEESVEGDGEMASEAELASMGLGNMEVRSMKLESECTEEEKEKASSPSSSLLGSLSIGSLWSSSSKSSASEPKPTTTTPSLVMPSIPSSTPAVVPPVSPSNATSQLPFSNELRAKTLLDAQTMNKLAALFAEGFPENEFSMAQLQGCTFLSIPPIHKPRMLIVLTHRFAEAQIPARGSCPRDDCLGEERTRATRQTCEGTRESQGRAREEGEGEERGEFQTTVFFSVAFGLHGSELIDLHRSGNPRVRDFGP